LGKSSDGVWADSQIKYVRILKREIRGSADGLLNLFVKACRMSKANVVKSGTVGLDLNISNVAYVADTKAGPLPFFRTSSNA